MPLFREALLRTLYLSTAEPRSEDTVVDLLCFLPIFTLAGVLSQIRGISRSAKHIVHDIISLCIFIGKSLKARRIQVVHITAEQTQLLLSNYVVGQLLGVAGGGRELCLSASGLARHRYPQPQVGILGQRNG